MAVQWSRQVATFPRDIFKYGWGGERIKGITRGFFETFKLSMKSLHASALISKRSSGSPAAGHRSALPLGASFRAHPST